MFAVGSFLQFIFSVHFPDLFPAAILNSILFLVNEFIVIKVSTFLSNEITWLVVEEVLSDRIPNYSL